MSNIILILLSCVFYSNYIFSYDHKLTEHSPSSSANLLSATNAAIKVRECSLSVMWVWLLCPCVFMYVP
ncbi:hypothetical protein ACFX19_036446 [Malus domestica]